MVQGFQISEERDQLFLIAVFKLVAVGCEPHKPVLLKYSL